MTILYDISVPIENSMVSWPGDPGVAIDKRLDLCCGDPATVSSLNLGVHTGTHVDAFSHFLKDGQSLSEMDLSRYIGPARVIEIQNPTVITDEELQAHDLSNTTRILFKTANSNSFWSREPFNEHFCHIHPDAAEYLVQQGIQLVGVDYLSVESYHAQTLYGQSAPTHQILMKAGIYIVEGLYLKDIPPGSYELTCLPLSLTGVDGAPARVILRGLA